MQISVCNHYQPCASIDDDGQTDANLEWNHHNSCTLIDENVSCIISIKRDPL